MPFDKATTQKLEDAFSKHGSESGLHHVYVSATHVVDLKEMTQKNVQTGYSRRILREVVKLPGAEAEFMALVSQFQRDVAPLAKQLVGTLVTLLGIFLKIGLKENEKCAPLASGARRVARHSTTETRMRRFGKF